MSTTSINFKTKLLVGGEEVPLITEAVFDQSDSQDGVKKGFIFKLDRDASDPPVTIQFREGYRFYRDQIRSRESCFSSWHQSNWRSLHFSRY